MNKNVIITGLLAVAVIAVVVAKKSRKTEPETVLSANIQKNQSAQNTAGSHTAPAAAEKPLPKLIELGSVSCHACKAMAPIIDELKESCAGKLDVKFIDVHNNHNAASQYNIRVIPTQIFFDTDGNELFRHTGFFPREDIIAKWKELGVTLTDKTD
jgi:thioredoxin 1